MPRAVGALPRREMLPSGAQDGEATERPRLVRERLEAAVSGLGELDYLRRRQEELVRAALELRDAEEQRQKEAQRSPEELLLEENILLLRTQLNCLRRRDAGLISQLQELDRQIDDLRLDPEASRDPPETDSRPSSGFYELSDAASGSLSNSSNSVFSESFPSPADADGRPPLPPADESPACWDSDGLLGGPREDAWSSETFRRSLLASADVSSKLHCDLLSWTGEEAHHYPSPLHAVSVQSPAVLLGLRKEAGSGDAPRSSAAPSRSAWPAPPSAPSCRRLESYVLGLLQRRVQPVRTCQPRTSVSAEPSRSVLRPAGSCRRRRSAPGSGAPGASDVGSGSPGRQRSAGRGDRDRETAHVSPGASEAAQRCSKAAGGGGGSGAGGPRVHGGKSASPAPGQDADRGAARMQRRAPLPPAAAQRRRPSSPDPALAPGPAPGPAPHRSKTPKASALLAPSRDRGIGSSHREGRKGEDRKGARARSGAAPTAGRSSEPRRDPRADKTRRVTRSPDPGGSAHPASSAARSKRVSAPVAGGRVLDAAGTPAARGHRSGVPRHHHHGNHHPQHPHTKLKPKRKTSRRSRPSAQVPGSEAFRCSRWRQEKGPQSPASVPSTPGEPMSRPSRLAAGSDSEYSAECASLFHSTIVDSSEDEESNSTTNCFGDSESGEDRDSGASDAGESGGGGAGRRRGAELRMTPLQAKAFVKVRASHTLKRKILRFRSGSLKLMTTV